MKKVPIIKYYLLYSIIAIIINNVLLFFVYSSYDLDIALMWSVISDLIACSIGIFFGSIIATLANRKKVIIESFLFFIAFFPQILYYNVAQFIRDNFFLFQGGESSPGGGWLYGIFFIIYVIVMLVIAIPAIQFQLLFVGLDFVSKSAVPRKRLVMFTLIGVIFITIYVLYYLLTVASPGSYIL